MRPHYAPPAMDHRQDRRASQSWRLTWWSVTVAVLALITPLLLGRLGHARLSLTTALAYGLVVISSLQLAREVVALRPRLVSTMFWIFVYVFMGLPSLAQTTAREFPLYTEFSYTGGEVRLALITIWIGIAGFVMGYRLLPVLRRRRRRVAERPARALVISPTRALLIGALGATLTTYVVLRFGIGALFESRDAGKSVFRQQTESGVRSFQGSDKVAGVLFDRLTRIPSYVALYLLLYRRRRRPRGSASPAWELPALAVLVAVNVIVNNFFSNGRFWFGAFALGILLVYLPVQRPRNIRLLIPAALVVLLLVFPYLDRYRRSDTTSVPPSGPAGTIIEDGSYSAFQMTVNGVHYVELDGHSKGTQLLGAATAFVPRELWKDKPTETGNRIGGGDTTLNRAASLWTEFYVDFGAAGVLVGFTLYGILIAWLDDRCRWPRGDFERIALPLLAVTQWYLLRGSLLPAVGSILPLGLLLWLGFRRLVSPGPDPAHRPVRVLAATSGWRERPARPGSPPEG